MPGGKFARANRAKREQKDAAQAAGADAAPAQKQNRRKETKKPQPKKDPWAAAHQKTWAGGSLSNRRHKTEIGALAKGAGGVK